MLRVELPTTIATDATCKITIADGDRSATIFYGRVFEGRRFRCHPKRWPERRARIIAFQNWFWPKGWREVFQRLGLTTVPRPGGSFVLKSSGRSATFRCPWRGQLSPDASLTKLSHRPAK